MITGIDYCKAKVSGRIDSGNALQFEQELMELVPSPCEGFTLDIEDLTYISSAGLRVLMRLRKSCNGPINIINANEQVYSVLEMTGFSQLFNVEKAFREISVDGCPVIGKGFYGTVYRLDADTVVKVYSSPESISLIRNEQKMAKAAFLKGIPTAISYDIVKVGDSYGSVFEMLKAKSFNDFIIENPNRIDEIVRRWCELLKQVHRTKMEPGVLPSCRDRHIDYLDEMKRFVPEDNLSRIKRLLLAVPDSLTAVHGDFQMKNVMLSADEPMLIDMDTLSAGHPIFDLAALYVTYQSFKEDEPGNTMDFLGIPSPTADYIWKSLMLNYFGPIGDEVLSSLTDKIRLVASIRFMYLLAISPLKEGELGSLRIQHTRDHIDELLSRVDNLIF